MSKYFIAALLGFIVGIFIGSYLIFQIFIYLGAILLISLIIFIFRTDFRVKIVSFGSIFLILGLFYIHLYQKIIPADTVSNYIGQEANLTGYISDDPDIRGDKINISFAARKINAQDDSKSIYGQVLVTVPRYPEYEFGQSLKISGKLEEPKIYPDFNYRNYLANQNIYSIMYQPKIEILPNRLNLGKIEKINFLVKKPLFTLKKRLNQKINQILPEPQSSFLAGLLLGAKKTLPESLQKAFVDTGTIHIVVVSGYNISIIIGAFLALTRRWSKKLAYSLALVGVISFVIMTGAEPPVIRAALMASVLIAAQRMGRIADQTIALLVSAVIILLFSPNSLRFDLGFELSFLATAGLIYLSPIFEKKFEAGFWKKIPPLISEPLIATLAAQVFVIPLILLNFHRLSLIAPLANILILPFIPAVMGLGALAIGLGFLWLALGKIVGWFLWIVLSYMIWVVESLAKIPAASLVVDNFFWYLLALYFLALGFFILRWNIKQKKVKMEIA